MKGIPKNNTMLTTLKIFGTHPSVIDDNDKRIGDNLDLASIHHSKAVTLLYEGKYEEAAENALLAQKHLDLASKVKRESIAV